MLYFSKLRILFITLFSVLFILIASSNLFKFDDNFFDKKINLGLDLQGGSYLLLEIDNEPVIEQKLQNLTTTIRNYFKEKNIKINNIKIENQYIFFNVADNYKQSVLDVFQDENSDNQITNEDRLGFIEKYGDIDLYTWNIGFSYFPSQQMIEPDLEFGSGDTLYIYTKKPFRNGDEFILKSYAPEVHYSPDYVDLSNVRVVPNPYIAATAIESSLPPGVSSGRGERKIEFQNVPNDAIIKIFNIRGQHIKTLKHDGNIFNGSVSWNLKTDENMDIAYGVYLYVLESPSGSTKGKIAIIK